MLPSRRSARALAALAALLAGNSLTLPVCAAEGESRRDAPAPLPVPPRLELPTPSARDLERLDALLVRLTSEQLEAREAASRELQELKPRQVAAIVHRLSQLAEGADGQAMSRLLAELQDKALKHLRSSKERPEAVEPPAPLDLVREDNPQIKAAGGDKASAHAHLVQVLALSRMLAQVGTIEATRALIGVYEQFGEFMRVPVQRELMSLGDRAVPALIEARVHPVEKIASFARQRLDALGRAVPSEAVQIPNPSTLADVLRAYGRIKDPDARRMLVSFANSDRAMIREAAREAIVLLGEVGIWQIRESYEETTGKRPPRDWSWEHLTRELFAELDRMRSATVMKLYEEGVVARARGDIEGMRRAFDLVLARDPRFERAEELSKAYLEYATAILPKQPRAAEEALARALRLSRKSEQKRSIESLLLTVQASHELERGVVDRSVLTRALDLDPKNVRARQLLEELTEEAPASVGDRAQRLALGTLALCALAALFVLFRRRPRAQAAEPLAVPSENDEQET